MLRDLIPMSGPRSLFRGTRAGDDPFHAMQREMNRMFERIWRDVDLPLWRGGGNGGLGVTMPPVDVSETEKEVVVTAELPGLEEKELDVTFAHGVLTIRGEHEAESEEKDKHYTKRERTSAAFQRSLAIGDEIKEDKIKATYANGVLKVVLPRAKEAKEKVKRIPVTH